MPEAAVRQDVLESQHGSMTAQPDTQVGLGWIADDDAQGSARRELPACPGALRAKAEDHP
jgi:hypothetical protein